MPLHVHVHVAGEAEYVYATVRRREVDHQTSATKAAKVEEAAGDLE